MDWKKHLHTCQTNGGSTMKLIPLAAALMLAAVPIIAQEHPKRL